MHSYQSRGSNCLFCSRHCLCRLCHIEMPEFSFLRRGEQLRSSGLCRSPELYIQVIIQVSESSHCVFFTITQRIYWYVRHGNSQLVVDSIYIKQYIQIGATTHLGH